MGVTNFLKKLFGNKSDRDIKEIMPIIDSIKVEYERISKLSNDGLRAESSLLKEKIRQYVKDENDEIADLRAKAENADMEESEKIFDRIDKLEASIDEKTEEILNEILPTAFSVVKETAKRFKENETIIVTANDFDRDIAAFHDNVEIDGDNALWHNHWLAGGNEVTWDMVHYDVQLIGGAVLHRGNIAEMATGEGKTLVATLPVFLNALPGRGVHVVTVNDYLAKRDSEWMSPIFQFHGLSVDCIDKHQPNSEQRRKAYLADITYGTNNEFGFDYLRDNMAINPEDLVQRKHNYAIVDEVDSVLIDDARTPLIISGPIGKDTGDIMFQEYRPKVEKLVQEQRKLVNQLLVDARKLLTKQNATKDELEEGALLLLRAHKGLPKNNATIKFLTEEGIKSQMLKSENYYMQDNNKNMHIVTDPLYFIIEEQHNSIELTDKGIDLLSSDVNDPDFFVLPDMGAQIASIENNVELSEEEKVEHKDSLMQDYSVKSERVHTLNQLLKAYTLFEKDVEYVVIDEKVKIVDEQTGRIMEGRRYSDGLHQAIEAKERVKVEAATQTFATITLQNYFRMYHKLSGMTGTAETEAGEFWDIYKLDVIVIPTNKPCIREDREDMVYKTRREKFNAIINEVEALNKKGRPVLLGTTSVEISELLSRMLKMKNIKHNVLNAKMHQREAEIVAEAGKMGTVTIATNMAGRGTDIKLTEEVKALGGLAIIGSERHDSRRVDRQLRGRAGRQGDPGSSQFFVALDDDLMRVFGTDRLTNVMDKMGLEDGEVIQHPMITRSIERAQKKVEENNFGIRKRLLEYDDVMNSQREVIYRRRRNALYGDRIGVDIMNNIYESVEELVEQHYNNDYNEFQFELLRIASISSPISQEEFGKVKDSEVVDRVFDAIMESYNRKSDYIAKQVMPVIKNVYENQSHQYKNIVIPFTDGKIMYQVIVNLEKAYNNSGREVVRSFEKQIMLTIIDSAWKEQLREMDDLRQSVQNASYEQKDPLLIYKLESFNLFKTMIANINRKIVPVLSKSQIPLRDPNEVREAEERRRVDMNRMRMGRAGIESKQQGGAPQAQNSEPQKTQPVHVEKKVGRNDPCPCGSGKKFKNCHGIGQL